MSKPFRSDKRKKELQRLKKQEEKRQRRFGLKQESDGVIGAEGVDGESNTMETGNNESEDGLSGDTASENEQIEPA